MEPILISLNDAAKLTSLSRTALNKHRARGKFPTEVRLGERRIGFVLTEVQNWIAARISERSSGGSAFAGA